MEKNGENNNTSRPIEPAMRALKREYMYHIGPEVDRFNVEALLPPHFEIQTNAQDAARRIISEMEETMRILLVDHSETQE